MEDGHQGLGIPAANKVEINFWNHRRVHIEITGPIETRAGGSLQDMPFQFSQTHRSEPRTPELSRRMEKIQVRGGEARSDGARHAEASFEQRPVETFTVEGDQDATFGKALIEREKKRMLLAEVAHKKLFNLQAPAIPPRQAH